MLESGFKKAYDSLNAYMKPAYSWFQAAEMNYDCFMTRHNNT